MKKEKLQHIVNIVRELYREKISRESNEMENLDLIDIDTLVSRIEEDFGDMPSEREIVNLIFQIIQE